MAYAKQQRPRSDCTSVQPDQSLYCFDSLLAYHEEYTGRKGRLWMAAQIHRLISVFTVPIYNDTAHITNENCYRAIFLVLDTQNGRTSISDTLVVYIYKIIFTYTCNFVFKLNYCGVIMVKCL